MAEENKFLDKTGLNYLVRLIKSHLGSKADLDENGKIPSSLLPSYVDDVLEFHGLVDNVTLTDIYYSDMHLVGVVFDKTREKFIGRYSYRGRPIYGDIIAPDAGNDIAEMNTPTEPVPERGKIYVDVNTNKSYRWSGSLMVEMSSGGVMLGETSSTAYAGDKGVRNAMDIAAMKEGDRPLVGLLVSRFNPAGAAISPWTIKKADGTVGPTTTATGNLTTTYGYSVDFSGNYIWKKTEGYKDPTAVNGGDWASKPLPASGVPSELISVDGITEDRVFTASYKAKKQGLILKDGIIKAAGDSDFDSKSISVRVHFRYKTVACSASDIPTLRTLEEMLSKANSSKWKLQDGRNGVLTGVTTSESDHFVYAYPSKLGGLTKITMNDATPLLQGGFTLQKMTVMDPETMKELEYNVYTSVQKGAFTNAKLDIA